MVSVQGASPLDFLLAGSIVDAKRADAALAAAVMCISAHRVDDVKGVDKAKACAQGVIAFLNIR
jgi:hypothetical protein